jgi:hypothetical protein
VLHSPFCQGPILSSRPIPPSLGPQSYAAIEHEPVQGCLAHERSESDDDVTYPTNVGDSASAKHPTATKTITITLNHSIVLRPPHYCIIISHHRRPVSAEALTLGEKKDLSRSFFLAIRCSRMNETPSSRINLRTKVMKRGVRGRSHLVTFRHIAIFHLVRPDAYYRLITLEEKPPSCKHVAIDW